MLFSVREQEVCQQPQQFLQICWILAPIHRVRAKRASPPTFELVAMDQVCVPHYLRINVLDKPGIMAEVTKILSESEISIEAVIQKELKMRVIMLQ